MCFPPLMSCLKYVKTDIVISVTSYTVYFVFLGEGEVSMYTYYFSIL